MKIDAVRISAGKKERLAIDFSSLEELGEWLAKQDGSVSLSKHVENDNPFLTPSPTLEASDVKESVTQVAFNMVGKSGAVLDKAMINMVAIKLAEFVVFLRRNSYGPVGITDEEMASLMVKFCPEIDIDLAAWAVSRTLGLDYENARIACFEQGILGNRK